jgi:general secretion pathway protein A
VYERFFGLVDAPFRLTPDPRYLFLSPKHADALAHLRLGLEESSGFVCITGDVGTGKTTLLRSFLAGLGDETSTAYIFNPTLSPLELLQTINAEFGIAGGNSRRDLIEALNAHLLRQREAGRRCIVVIDEAQAVSIEVLEQLRLLSNLETTTEKLLRIVLVGQPQLRGLLLHPELVQLNQRITLRWHIGPLSRPETAAYVRHRVEVASGGQEVRLFTRLAVRHIHRYADGVPRLINMVAHRSLLAAFAAGKREVTARYVRRAYREIATVPLPKPMPAPWRAAAATVGIGACLGVIVLGARELSIRSDPPATAEAAASRAPDRAAVPSPTPEAVASPPPVASARPVTAAVPTVAPVLPAPATDTPPLADTAEAHLLALDREASAKAALDAVLVAWHGEPLADDDRATPSDYARLARRRGLEHLGISGNTGMLRLLDLPAILELQLPDASGPRYAALLSLREGSATLVIEGEPTPVDTTFLERFWLGHAYILWRDFDDLGGVTLEPQATGPAVRQLQGLLRKVGVYSGADTGVYDAATTAAVLEFQRSRSLYPDARVGRLTRIVLYAASGGYQRPTLAAAPGGMS